MNAWPTPTLEDYRDAERRVLANVAPFGSCLIYRGAPARDYPMIGVLRDPRTGWLRFPVGVALVVARAAGLVPLTAPSSGPRLEVDHLCHTPRCVNLDHLRALPREVNAAARRDRPLHPYLEGVAS